jgi:FdhD protein
MVARVNLPPHRAAVIMERARRRLGDSSCGICGIESVEMALRPLPRIAAQAKASPQADPRRAGRHARGAGAGARNRRHPCRRLADHEGALVLLREDVGRHNALDKVIGALAVPGAIPVMGSCLSPRAVPMSWWRRPRAGRRCWWRSPRQRSGGAAGAGGGAGAGGAGA